MGDHTEARVEGGILKPYKSTSVTTEGILNSLDEDYYWATDTPNLIVQVENLRCLEHISQQIHELHVKR